MNTATNKPDKIIIILRILTITIFILAFGIAGVQYGMASRLSEEGKELAHTAYNCFEYYFRAVTIFLGAYLSLRHYKQSRKKNNKLHRQSLIAFSIASFIFLVLWPLVTGFYKFYMILMPFPWSGIQFQWMAGVSASKAPMLWGFDGTAVLIAGYFFYQAVVFIGTLFLGRRWQCSMICMCNGNHAETLGLALPFFSYNKKRPKSKQIPEKARKVLRTAQPIFFITNMIIMGCWIIYLVSGTTLFPLQLLVQVEMIKYLFLELLIFMALWFVIGGRGYCFYCPAGYFLGIIGNAMGQKIETGLTDCVSCGLCNDACKLSIDVQKHAEEGRQVKAFQCVGCGMCVDACPTRNLRYRTWAYKSN